jgi:hypothetical protein
VEHAGCILLLISLLLLLLLCWVGVSQLLALFAWLLPLLHACLPSSIATT